MTERSHTLLDHVIIKCDTAIGSLFGIVTHEHRSPSDQCRDAPLSNTKQKHHTSLMRINHAREICIQTLYRGQMRAAKEPQTYTMLNQICAEELDHLA